MASRKPRKSESVSRRGSISEHASDWVRRFSKELEDNFINAAASIPADAPARDYQDATIWAVFSVLLDSGMDTESFAETVGRVLIEKRTASVEWTSEFNQRRRLEYLNLVYACRRCNSVNRDQAVGDPLNLLRSENVAALPDGSLHATDTETRRLLRQLDLNSPRLKKWRRLWMRIVTLAEEHEADLYYQLVGFPKDLPDLGKLKPPGNDRRDGLQECWFARRRRGELPSVY